LVISIVQPDDLLRAKDPEVVEDKAVDYETGLLRRNVSAIALICAAHIRCDDPGVQGVNRTGIAGDSIP